jgi:iron complex outermembrane receptor protein
MPVVAIAVPVLFASASPVGAETGARLAEIIVTAQKREQNVQDVGASIAAFNSEALKNSGVMQLSDLVLAVPGLQYNQFAPTVTIFNIRGVSQNDYSDHHEPPIAVYSDEAYIASMGAISDQMFDLERIEVLRGPQGTLFGRNATGGLIQYLSKAPAREPSVYLQLTGGHFGEFDAEGAAGGALTDGVSGRLSFATSRHDGYVRNRIGPDPGDANQYAMRGQLKIDVASGTDVLLKLHGSRNNHEVPGPYTWSPAIPNANGLGRAVLPTEDAWGTCTGCDAFGYREPDANPFTGSFDRAAFFNRTIYGATGRIRWSGERATLTSITDYLHMTKRYGEDTDVSPNPIYIYDTDQTHRQFSEELRLNGDAGILQWIAGVYFLDLHTDNFGSIGLPPEVGGPSGASWRLNTTSWAVFGQGEWGVSERFSLLAGLRFTSDSKTDRYEFFAPTPATVLLSYNPNTFPGAADKTFNNVTGKLELDFRPVPGTLLYASLNRGAKAGGWSAPVGPPVDPQLLSHRQEILTSYELGLKRSFADDSVRFDAAAFYYDYHNYQAFFQQNFVTIIGNRNAAVLGGELEAEWLPLPGLRLQLGAAALATRVKNVVLPTGQAVTRKLPQAPTLSLSALLRYEHPVAGGTLAGQFEFKWDDDYYFSAFNAPVDFEPAHSTSTLRLSYATGDGHWEGSAFLRNLTDERYRVYSLDLSVAGVNQSVLAPPRWWGVSLLYRWQ